MRRRDLLAAALGAGALTGCGRPAAEPGFDGGWLGASHQRGHALRDQRGHALRDQHSHAPRDGAASDPVAGGPPRRVSVLIAGGGVAGLAAVRALQRAGIDDFALLELEDEVGGNARGHRIGGIDCPLGAHYLPLPGAQARELGEWLHELGLARSELGRTVWDERYLAHAPQERLFVNGAQGAQWIEGLLPLQDATPATLAALRRFADEVDAARRTLAFSMPTLRSPWSAGLAALDAEPFAAWLDARGHRDPALRWYLDYCCRDDYGAGAHQVSAWAGLHYFASRHGFHAPGAQDDEQAHDAVLTWPEGNAWLTRRLAADIGAERLHTGRVVRRIAPGRHEVEVEAIAADGEPERWVAQRVIVALPLFIAAHLIDPLPPALAAAAAHLRYAPWLVSNLHLREPLLARAGVAPAWDNVLHASPALGYVDARHQTLDPRPGPTVLTHYWALGGDSAAELAANRGALLQRSWQDWARAVLEDLGVAHADIARRVDRIDLMRYGHAMAIPTPGLRGDPALAALAARDATSRLAFAHADLSAYSVFEEAFTRGTLAGEGVGRALAGAGRARR
ncbi:FAD-dependent oxidoreductase [Rivibacter subsaxonicus]|uniref:Tryptophan 2-monooxygenase n=1 Tax=Rivibacter subsaxonicus TaxID=457575 RepID=A0A4Q7VVD1_9BURK|nr:FAD-dependent oxidoreductase [Rivibacter subsaxonicus]RZU00622.1 flavin-dependent amine oxidoreductase [Rivibacter subsaxonicus]